MDEIRQEPTWTMMFVYDTVTCSKSRQELEMNLEGCRYALVRRGMKVRRKTSRVDAVARSRGKEGG